MEEAQAETNRCDCKGPVKPYFLRPYYLCLECGAQYPCTPEEVQTELTRVKARLAEMVKEPHELVYNTDERFTNESFVWGRVNTERTRHLLPQDKCFSITAVDLHPLCPEHEEPMVLGSCPECDLEEE